MKRDVSYQTEANSWALYHWASNAYLTTIATVLLPIFFLEVAASNLSPTLAAAYWGYANSAAVLFVALLAPILGTVANLMAARKRFLLFFTLIGVLSSIFFYFVTGGRWHYALAVFVVSSIAYSLTEIFQNSLLPHIARPKDIDRISARGFALGYLGGGSLLAINLTMIYFIPDNVFAVRLCFLTVPLWWALFSIPLILFVKEPAYHDVGMNPNHPWTEGFRLLIKTLRQIRRYRQLFIFLIAFWLYNDGIGTIIKMATIYGASIGIDRNAMVGALLMTQFVGIPFSMLFGKLPDFLGTKNCIFLGIFVYILISIGGYFMTRPIEFWVLAFLVGTVQGGTQALSRSLYGSMIPKAQTAEFFGFYGASSKVGGFIGPLVFALVSQFTGSSRLSILAIVFFFITGGALLSFVNVEEGRKMAG